MVERSGGAAGENRNSMEENLGMKMCSSGEEPEQNSERCEEEPRDSEVVQEIEMEEELGETGGEREIVEMAWEAGDTGEVGGYHRR